MTTGLQVLSPITVTAAMLTASDVPEPATGANPDPAAWAVGTTYALAARVHVASAHKIYESLQAGNLGKDPTLAANSAWWIEVGATNRWRMFDERNTSQTTRTGGIDVTVTPGQTFNAVALLNLTNVSSVRIRLTDPVEGLVYDVTTVLQAPPSIADWYTYFFEAITRKNSYMTALPTYRQGALRVNFNTASPSDVAGVGVMAVGPVAEIGGGIFMGASVGIQDYSRKEANAFGDYEVVERAFAKRANMQTWITSATVDAVQELLASLRATPAVWIGSNRFTATFVYGFYKDFDITLQYYDYAALSIQIEGLT